MHVITDRIASILIERTLIASLSPWISPARVCPTSGLSVTLANRYPYSLIPDNKETLSNFFSKPTRIRIPMTCSWKLPGLPLQIGLSVLRLLPASGLHMNWFLRWSHRVDPRDNLWNWGAIMFTAARQFGITLLTRSVRKQENLLRLL